MDRKKVLDIAGFDIADDKIFFVSRYVNGLFQMDMHTGKIEYLVSSDRESLEASCLYSDIKIDNGKVWCIPYSADQILIYHLAEKSCTYIEIPKLTGKGREWVKFNTAYDYGDQIILLPAEYPAILKINKLTYDIDVIQWEQRLLQDIPDFYDINSHPHIARDFEIIGSVMYLLAENVVIKYNMDSNNLSFARLDHDSRMYSGIIRFQNQIVLVERLYSEIVLWDEERITKIDVNLGFQGLEAEDDGCPLGLCKVGEGFVVIQGNADFLVLVDEKTEVKKIKLDKKSTGLFSDCYRQNDDLLVLSIDGQNQLLLVNTKDFSQNCIEMDFNDFDFSWFKAMIGVTKKYVKENTVYYDLTDFIDVIIKQEKESVIKESYQIGNDIYQTMYKGM